MGHNGRGYDPVHGETVASGSMDAGQDRGVYSESANWRGITIIGGSAIAAAGIVLSVPSAGASLGLSAWGAAMVGGAFIGFGTSFAITGGQTGDVGLAFKAGGIGCVAGVAGGAAGWAIGMVAGSAMGMTGAGVQYAGFGLVARTAALGAAEGVAGGGVGGFAYGFGDSLLLGGGSLTDALRTGMVYAGWGATIGGTLGGGLGAIRGGLAVRAAASAPSSAVWLGTRQLPNTSNPWVRFQRWVTGRDYEEVWQLSSRQMAADARRAGYLVDAKWTGRNEAAWRSSPYNPTHRFYDEAKIVDQVVGYLELNASTNGRGVRYAISNEAGRAHFESLFRRHFPQAMENGILQVWHVPGTGM